MTADLARLADSGNARLIALGEALRKKVARLETAGMHILSLEKSGMAAALSVAVPFMHLAGIVCGAWQWGRAALLAVSSDGCLDDSYLASQTGLAEFYFLHVLPGATGYGDTVLAADSGTVDSALLC